MGDHREILGLARDLAARAAALQLDRLGEARAHVDTKSSATDMVTEVDRECERLIAGGATEMRADDSADSS